MGVRGGSRAEPSTHESHTRALRPQASAPRRPAAAQRPPGMLALFQQATRSLRMALDCAASLRAAGGRQAQAGATVGCPAVLGRCQQRGRSRQRAGPRHCTGGLSQQQQ